MGKKELVLVPDTISMPFTGQVAGLGSGFEPDDYVVLGFPWQGTPQSFSVIGLNLYADANGEVRFSQPEPPYVLNLAPGTYPLLAQVWIERGGDWVLAKGPKAELVVR